MRLPSFFSPAAALTASWIADVTLSKADSPGPQHSAPSLTLSVSRSQVTEGLFLALVSTAESKLTTEHPID